MARPGFGWVLKRGETRPPGGAVDVEGGGVNTRPNQRSATRLSVPEDTAGTPRGGRVEEGFRPLESPNYNDSSAPNDSLSKRRFSE
jgi:hypothetical protein